jgi:VWFA-related protein
MRWIVFTAVIFTLVAAAHPGEGQLAVNVDLVNNYFTVCNSKGRLIPDLGRDRFSIFEDGQPQTITHFSKETDVATTMMLLIDSSGSVRDKLGVEQQSAREFLHATLRPGRDEAAILTFDHIFRLRQDYTDDTEVLSKALERIVSGGGTRLYDALHFALEDKMGGRDGRKIIVLITDGDDNSSRRSPHEVVVLAQRHNVAIYVISVNAFGISPDRSSQSNAILTMLASETGGRAFFPSKVDKLAADFRKIAHELRSQYAIGYRSTNPNRDGAFRQIRIEVRNTSYSVRSRTGYYAPAETIE